MLREQSSKRRHRKNNNACAPSAISHEPRTDVTARIVLRNREKKKKVSVRLAGCDIVHPPKKNKEIVALSLFALSRSRNMQRAPFLYLLRSLGALNCYLLILPLLFPICAVQKPKARPSSHRAVKYFPNPGIAPWYAHGCSRTLWCAI